MITGCGGLQTALDNLSRFESNDNSPRTPEEYLTEARGFSEQGRWSDAMSTVRQGLQDYPDNIEIYNLRDKIDIEWEQDRLLLENRLLLVETSSLLQAKALLEKLAEGSPNDPFLRSRIVFHEQALQNRMDDLMACGMHSEPPELRQARRCLLIADRIAPTAEIRDKLQVISRKIEALEQASVARREEREQATQARKDEQVEKRRSERVRKLISEAERESKQGALTNAMPLLEEALKQDPENVEVRQLINEVQLALENQATVLIKLGDRLYRDEQLGPAIAVWGAALKLDPARLEIADKLDRARRIFAKLESIRAGATESPDTIDWLENP